MRLRSLKLNNLEDLYIQQLRDLYSTESQIIDALPLMADAATSPELKTAFNQHLEQTRSQMRRLDNIFAKLDVSPEGEKSNAIDGLVSDGNDIIKADGDPAVRDAGLIAAAQRVEHYEIAGYGCARTYASQLGHRDHAEMLQQILEEEAATDKKLTQLAENRINLQAASRTR
jgi:ferritin-like metal-binding protein YciE